ncbi:hypothetical protein MMB17_12745 [Methylobacterium organophilum]|uniref:hypothetical protein n=1 Tax=Methylobacterium organophilum TaxID=410 RepID=UPI001F136F6C|nr:hypothetical protein [Methylobacterium organophilum]UMY15624.1 hypothetical protein MMB17_12745 [Methylobacterium organophilum]
MRTVRPAFFDVGTFYQEGSTKLINSYTFLDDTNSRVVFCANEGRTHTDGVFVDRSNGKYSVSISGAKLDSFIWTSGVAPAGIKLQGTVTDYSIQLNDGSKSVLKVEGSHSVAAVHTVNANLPHVILVGANQKITIGPFSMYSDGAKIYFLNEATQVLIASIDGNGNAIFRGTVSQGNPAS